jgi:DNA mismatch repair protein MutL
MENHDVRIEVLPQSVVEKIAAGEVIERPASVLKELIENSIDAEATTIDVAVEDSGFSLLQVSDNGSGMSSANLKKCLLMHATSKIKKSEDLYAISTMGFRGEALASIAAVSRMSITSSATDDGLGCAMACEGGIMREPQPASHVRGTTVTCRDLFFNVPARKKFMKSRKAERLALVRLLEQVAIPFPRIHFTAVFEGKTVFDVPPANSLLMRISQVAGIEFAKSLVQAQGDRDGMEALLYFPAADDGSGRPRFQGLYVNLRRVENEQVTYAVREVFGRLIRRDYRPSYFCFIDVDPSKIDVNVHPTKQKVKFENERELFGFIYGIVAGALKPLTQAGTHAPEGRRAGDGAGEYEPAVSDRGKYPVIAEKEKGRIPQPSVAEATPDQRYGQTMLEFPSQGREREKSLESAGDETIQLSESGHSGFLSLISCYQIHEMFILAPTKNGILLIDQHAAHERILFEQALLDMKQGRSTSQQLLFPIVLQLSATEHSVVESGNEYFRAFGFDIQDFGGTAAAVSAMPAFMKNADVERSVREMIQYLLDEKTMGQFPDAHTRFAAAFACGAAIKAGQTLSQEEMIGMLNSLFSSENPYTCPHGRPTVVRLSLDELSRRFLR